MKSDTTEDFHRDADVKLLDSAWNPRQTCADPKVCFGCAHFLQQLPVDGF
jgi:hypothetical protein